MKRVSFFLVITVGLVVSQTDRVPPLSIGLADGERTTIHELLKEGPLLIDFWALWCAPCLKSMRHLDTFHTKYADMGFTVLAINLDTQRSQSKVRSYIRSKRYKFPVALDPAQDSFRRLNGNSIPYTLLIDSSGRIVKKHTGYVPGDERILEKEILALISAESDNSSPTVQ